MAHEPVGQSSYREHSVSEAKRGATSPPSWPWSRRSISQILRALCWAKEMTTEESLVPFGSNQACGGEPQAPAASSYDVPVVTWRGHGAGPYLCVAPAFKPFAGQLMRSEGPPAGGRGRRLVARGA
jgi:hypothetical protein